jgi:hypothetical protein
MKQKNREYQCGEIFDKNQIFLDEKKYNETETFQDKYKL